MLLRLANSAGVSSGLSDLNAGGAALLITLLVEHQLDFVYIPGRTVHHASAAYRGDGKTDAKDAAVIADQARMRRDLHPFRQRDEITMDLRLLCARRTDLAMDRNRAIARLRATLLEYFPALERAFDYAHRRGALTLADSVPDAGSYPPSGTRQDQRVAPPTRRIQSRHHRTDSSQRRSIAAHRRAWTNRPQLRSPRSWPNKSSPSMPNMDTIEAEITERFRDHAYAPAIESMPGFGPLLGAELLVGINGDTS